LGRLSYVDIFSFGAENFGLKKIGFVTVHINPCLGLWIVL